MGTERSDSVWSSWQTASLQADFVMSGICTAVTAYVFQTIHFGKLGWNPESLELFALTLFAVATLASLLRTEKFLLTLAANHRLIYHSEMKGGLVAVASKGEWFLNHASGQQLSKIDALFVANKHGEAAAAATKVTEAASKSAQSWYRRRNWFLLFGFIALVGGRLWAQYS